MLPYINDVRYIERAIVNAATYGRMETIKFLLSLGVDNLKWAICNAVEANRVDIVKLLLNNGYDDYDTLIDMADRCGHLDLFDYLVELKDISAN